MYAGSGVANGAKQYYRADPQGSIIAITDYQGNVVDTYTYDAYGMPDDPSGNAIRYTGRRWDAETGLYYYRARMYSPAIGRFLQTDPIGYGDGPNIYAYTKNDPANANDPSGNTSRTCLHMNPKACRISAPRTPSLNTAGTTSGNTGASNNGTRTAQANTGGTQATTTQSQTQGATSVSQNGVNFIKGFEGFEQFPSADPLGNLTVGFGHKLTATEITNGIFSAGITQTQADTILRQDLAIVEADISRLVTVPLTQNQFDAVASLIFNIGASKFSGFNLLTELNNGNFQAASQEFLDIDKGRDPTGRLIRLPGLTRRRAAESQLFNTP